MFLVKDILQKHQTIFLLKTICLNFYTLRQIQTKLLIVSSGKTYVKSPNIRLKVIKLNQNTASALTALYTSNI